MTTRQVLGVRPVLAAAVVCALLGALAGALNPFLEYRRTALEALQLWRLFTAHAAHLDALHGALNGAALVIIWRIGRDSTSLREWAWLLLGSVAAVDAGLYWLSPDVEWYVGASGALHGLLGGVAVLMLDRGARAYGVTLLLVLAGKLAWETVTGLALTRPMHGAVPVVTVAHLYGGIGGVSAALLARATARRA